MKKILLIIVGMIFGVSSVSVTYGQLRTVAVPQGGTGASTLTGCLEGNGSNPITGTGSPCGSPSGLGPNMLVGINSSGALVSTSSPTVGYISATSTTATSTFLGGLNVGNNGAFSVQAEATANTLVVTTAGRVGIGTTAPGYKLQIGNGVDSTHTLFKVDGLYSDVTFAGDHTPGPIWDFTNTGTGAGTRFYVQDANNLADRLTFDFRGNGGSNLIMAGTSAGNVGIGTTTPSDKLNVYGNANIDGNIRARLATDAMQSSRGIQLIPGAWNGQQIVRAYNNAGGGLQIETSNTGGTGAGNSYINLGAGGASSIITFGTNSASSATEKMRLDASGNLGIGTTNPTSKLNIIGNYTTSNSTSGSDLGFGAADSDLPIFGFRVGASPYDLYLNIRQGGGTDLTALTVQRATGNVGIGTTSPNNKLDIYSTTKSAIGFSGASGDTYKWTMGMDVSNAGRFSIASSTALGTTDRLVIDGNGNIGIGTTSPYASLSILNSSATNGLALAASTTLQQASGNETAYTLNYTTNKAAGNDTGLLINMTDTASPGTSLLQDWQVGGVSKAYIRNDGLFDTVSSIQALNIASRSTSLSMIIKGYGGGSYTGSTALPYLTVGGGSNNATAGSQTWLNITPTYNQTSGTAANTDLLINRTETAVGSGSQYLTDWQVGGVSKAVITNAGKLGIGTTSPYSILSISNNLNTTADTPLFTIASTTAGTATSTLLTVLANGKVGIGKANPAATLDLGVVSGYPNTWSNSTGYLFNLRTYSRIFYDEDDSTYFIDPNGATSAVLNGKIALGTTTPNNKLDIYSTSKSAIGFSGASGSTYKWTMGMDVSNGGRFSIASSTALGTTDRLVIDGNGNVGIGTTTPTGRLHVSAGTSATTTISHGEIGSATSKACYNTKNTAGADVSWYIVGTTMVIENNLCR